MKDYTKIDWQLRVENAVIQITENMDNDISLFDLSEKLYSSPFHFHRMFMKLTGESVKNCIKRLRLEKAGKLLKTTEKQIIEIALDSGYDNPDSFTKAFKKSHTVTPTMARKLEFWNWELPSKAGIHYQNRTSKNWFFIFSNGGEKMNIKIVDMQPRKLICLKGKGDYWGLPAAWKEFHEKLEKNKYHHHGNAYMSVFFDHSKDEVAWADKRWAAAMSIDGNDAGKGITERDNLEIVTTEGGIYAVAVHFGSYEQIGEAWDKWRNEWLPESGWELDKNRPSFEWYQNDFNSVQPELLLTLLCDPVIKKK